MRAKARREGEGKPKGLGEGGASGAPAGGPGGGSAPGEERGGGGGERNERPPRNDRGPRGGGGGGGERGGGGGAGMQVSKEYFMAICAECGKEAQLPFKPQGDRPVFCGEGFGEKEAGTLEGTRK